MTYKIIIIGILLTVNVSAFTQQIIDHGVAEENCQSFPINTHNLNDTTQTISLTGADYCGQKAEVWNINFNSCMQRPVKIVYDIEVVDNVDFVDIFAVNGSNKYLIRTVTGSEAGSISTILPNGEACIQFRINSEPVAGNYYAGLKASFSEGSVENTSVSDNVFVNRDMSVLGSAYIGTAAASLSDIGDANLDLWATCVGVDASRRLEVAGNNQDYSIYSYNVSKKNSDTYGIYSYATNSNSGANVYGLYSNVSSASSNKWAGYFYGGNVQVTNGNLITSNGKVGIGTTTPQNALEVFGNVYLPANNSYWIGSYSDSGNRLKLHHNGYNAYIDYLPNLYFRADGTTNSLTLLQNGNVGIGTTEPQTKLAVNGEIQVGIDKPEIEGYGDRLSFLGKNNNSDPLWIARYNISTNASELRVNIGDDASDDDRFVVGNHLYSNDVWYPHFTVTNTGKVGIGTAEPQALLDMGSNAPNEMKAILARLPEGGNTWLSVNSYDSQPLYGKMFAIENKFYNTINSSINFHRGGGSEDGFITFDVNSGVRIAKLCYRGLDVYGIIAAKQVIATETGWADFVFKDNYLLRPLQEVNEYIQVNKRLPDIPSEQEVKESGVNLGDMQTKLLQKIEELTLYVIQQQKDIDKLNAQIEQLKSNNSHESK